jgi:AraC-like DNA-binding protein
MKLIIKYMVSNRCKMVVEESLKELGLHSTSISLGEVEIEEQLTDEQLGQVKAVLLRFGLELMDDKKAMLIEKIKNVITEMIHYSDELPKLKFSVYLGEKLNYNYTYLANLFSETEGTTIEHYILLHKIERVKELILYDELNLTEIAWKMHYSSVAHLSRQFKQITGLTPTFFKALKVKRRSMLEDL